MNVDELVVDLNPWWRDPEARLGTPKAIRRDLQPHLLGHLLNTADRRAFAITGPRQVGKTTMLWQLAADLLDRGWPPGNLTYFDFSDARIVNEISASEVVEVKPITLIDTHPKVLLFDEISHAVNWDRWLKNTVDLGGFRIGVTDSAASLLRTGSVESGQGRWDEYSLEGLTFREFLRLSGDQVEEPEEILARLPNLFERYLAIGGFPEHVGAEDFGKVRRRIREDVAGRAISRDLSREGVDVQRVERLFVFLAQESGTILNLSDRAAQLGADRRSVRDWLRLLEGAALIARLRRFGVKPSSRMRGAEKIYMPDHGFVTAFSFLGRDEQRVRSRVFEAVVFRHLRQLVRTREGRITVFRPEENLELDFVLETQGDRIGIEVTSSPSAKGKIAQLSRAAESLKAEGAFLIFGGYTQSRYEGIEVVPLREFLLDPAAILGLEVG